MELYPDRIYKVEASKSVDDVYKQAEAKLKEVLEG
jgi:dTMP kinase